MQTTKAPRIRWNVNQRFTRIIIISLFGTEITFLSFHIAGKREHRGFSGRWNIRARNCFFFFVGNRWTGGWPSTLNEKWFSLIPNLKKQISIYLRYCFHNRCGARASNGSVYLAYASCVLRVCESHSPAQQMLVEMENSLRCYFFLAATCSRFADSP